MSKPQVPAPGPHLDPPAPDEAPAGPPHLFVQAPVPPLDVDGMTAVVIGVIAFALVSLGLGWFYPRLTAAGDGWWLWVGLSGLGLGLVGLVYTGTRRRHRRAA